MQEIVSQRNGTIGISGTFPQRSSVRSRAPETAGGYMLSWALTFFIVAIIAAVLGFTTIAGAAAGIAKILFFIFLVLTLVALVAGALRGRPPV
jgi:uncharacterized membrane protein YtjA (UPF0391 family)